MSRDTVRSLARICRRLRLPGPRHDHSTTHGRWLEPTPGADARENAPRRASGGVPAASGAGEVLRDARGAKGATGRISGGES